VQTTRPAATVAARTPAVPPVDGPSPADSARSVVPDDAGTGDAAGEGVIVEDADGVVIAASPGALALLGAVESSLVGQRSVLRTWSAADVDGAEVPEEDRPLARARASRRPEVAVLGLGAPDGSRRWVRVRAEVLVGGGILRGVAAVVTAAGAPGAARPTVASPRTFLADRSPDLFASIIDTANDMIVVEDVSGVVRFANPALQRVLGIGPDELVGARLADLVHPDDRAALLERARSVRTEPGAVAALDVRLRRRDGEWRTIVLTVRNGLADPGIAGVVVNGRDVTERVVAAQRHEYRSLHDELTGLANRALLIDHLESALHRARRSGRPGAVMFIDIDHFKGVNDSFGHAVGDQVLVGVAGRLRAAVRNEDTVARIGGDEFVVLAENAGSELEATDLAERIRSLVAGRIPAGGEVVPVAVSIGVALDATGPPDSLLRMSDIALYRAKDRGRDRCELFRPE
jgi:diguanylate cyclase (GGDEF)-like protein/PAS domain S-box-containing protein